MADTGKQSPLGVNVLGSILQNRGYTINKYAASFMGASKTNSQYSFGSLVQGTVLRLQTWGIHDAYNRGRLSTGVDSPISTLVSNSVYDNLIYIGFNYIPSLGNARSPRYLPVDNSGLWTAGGTPASTAWALAGNTWQTQNASWIPYNTSNVNRSVTMWGYIRCHALQAWNEFKYNSNNALTDPEYKEFCSSFLSADAFVNYSNQAIFAMEDSKNFLVGTFSNSNDLISADITGVNLSTNSFGIDLLNLGTALDLSTIATFGLPSTLLRTLGLNGAITQDLSLALISAGLSSTDISKIGLGQKTNVTREQEQQIYGAFLLIQGTNLLNVLAPLRCKTAGLITLADLLSVRKMFPSSYPSMTVPIYNIAPGPTNSKTYYLIYSGSGINSIINTPAMQEIVGEQIPSGVPPINDSTVTGNNYTLPPKGFGGNLIGIIPEDDAVAAGAFSYSMRQIRNIEQATITKFAEVAYSTEISIGNTLATGTDRPVVTEMANYGTTVCAQGSGTVGSYTMSDLFGCMSGLPYPWRNLQSSILNLQTRKLHNIYQQNFLAITWEKAQMRLTQNYFYRTVQPYIPPPVSPNDNNPAYDPRTEIPNPAYNPSLPPGPGNEPTIPNPDYNDNPYVNPSTGGETTCPTYYSAPGQPAIYDWYYTLTLSQPEDGGGYGRGTAPNPIVTIAPNNVGASATTTVGRNDETAQSLGGGTFGRVSAQWNNGGEYRWYANDVQTNWLNIAGSNTDAAVPTPPVMPPRPFSWVQANIPRETITIQHPPIAQLPVQPNGDVATNGQNTPGDVWADDALFGGLQTSGTNPWPSPMNSNIQSYIDQANLEIQVIATNNPTETVNNNTIYNILGTQLTREQRTRYISLPPVPVPKDIWINLYPTSLYVFVDSIPSLAQNTRPHMSAQTLENISDLETTGGQSTVVMQRQERNQSRLQTVGIPLDNNLNTDMTSQQAQVLTMNGVIPGAVDGVPSGTKNYTLPAWPGNLGDGGDLIQPRPTGRMINTGPITTDGEEPGELTPILKDLPFPVVGPIVPVGPGDYVNFYPEIGQVPELQGDGDPNNIPGGGDPGGGGGPGGGGNSGGGGSSTGGGGPGIGGGGGNGNGPGFGGNGGTGTGSGGTTGPGTVGGDPGGIVIVAPPPFGAPLGKPNIPINLNPLYTSSTLLPATLSVQEAIEKVIECNCDCWIT